MCCFCPKKASNFGCKQVDVCFRIFGITYAQHTFVTITLYNFSVYPQVFNSLGTNYVGRPFSHHLTYIVTKKHYTIGITCRYSHWSNTIRTCIQLHVKWYLVTNVVLWLRFHKWFSQEWLSPSYYNSVLWNTYSRYNEMQYNQ